MSRGEFQLRMGLTQDGELLPKSDIVKSQFATSLEGGDPSVPTSLRHFAP